MFSAFQKKKKFKKFVLATLPAGVSVLSMAAIATLPSKN